MTVRPINNFLSRYLFRCVYPLKILLTVRTVIPKDLILLLNLMPQGKIKKIALSNVVGKRRNLQ